MFIPLWIIKIHFIGMALSGIAMKAWLEYLRVQEENRSGGYTPRNTDWFDKLTETCGVVVSAWSWEIVVPLWILALSMDWYMDRKRKKEYGA